MVLFRLYKTQILTLISLVCIISLSSLYLATASAEDKSASSNKNTNIADANETKVPSKSTPAPAKKAKTDTSDTAKKDSEDPNTPADENDSDSDIFELDLSAMTKINEAYSNIFTPELITSEGYVEYSTLKRKPLDRLSAKRELKKLNPAILMILSKKERAAFWINTYNFCTIELILRHYPIQPKWYMIIYPDNSIMQITGAWEKEFFWIQGEQYNLKEIQQGFLLKRYKDPRICFALSNASIGGATLRNKPYKAEHLDAQLDEQVKEYLAAPKGLRLDKTNHILYLSNLFQEHKDTFLASEYATVKKFRNRNEEERTWLNFISPYLSKEDVRYLETEQFKIRFIDVDWHLNEAP